jgi:outer membrane receptor protein involved in Fe transport
MNHPHASMLCRHIAQILALAACGGVAAPVLAQDAPPPPTGSSQGGETGNGLGEVVVTGSRIAVPNQTSTSPIVSLSAAEIATTGRTQVGELLQQLPQNFFNSLGQDLGNRTSGLTTAGGVATADLRGLGPNRTLVLVDGIRLGQGSPYTAIASPAPDLDQIPPNLVERVEVVTGGASAVYGSDAIAGVVNFIMKKNFTGLQIDGQWGENWHRNHNRYAQGLERDAGVDPVTGTSRDGRNRTFSILAGTDFADGKGNVTGYVTYLTQDPVRSGDRDFGACQLALNATLDGLECSGSANSNYFRPQTGPNAGTPYSVLNGQFVPFGTPGTNPPAAFNSQPYIYMQRQDQRVQAGFISHVDLQDWAQPYAQFFFMNDRTHQEIAPSGLFRDSNPNDPLSNNYNVNCGNPLLSSQQQSVLCSPADIASDANVNVRIGRRNIEGGSRTSDYEHTNYRVVLGSKGKFADAFNYDVYGQYYYVNFYNANTRYLNFQNIDNALQVTGTAANPVCKSGPPCVPYNIWGTGPITPEQLAYLSTTGTAYGTTTLRTLHADVTGDLGTYGVKLPTANDGVAFNVGWEHRNENVSFQPDVGELSGQLSGFGGAAVAVNNSVAVKEWFGELRVPLVQSKPGIRDLLFDAGYRRSDYSTAGAVDTYKGEFQYAPIEDVRLRASYNRAIRAPSIIELYNPQLVGQIQIGLDPCAPTTNSQGVVTGPPAASLAQCLRTVAPENQAAFTTLYNSGLIPQGTAGQLSQLQGGNTALKPEQADTYTFGLNFTPTMLRDFNASVDYWRIKLKGTVGTLPASTVLTNCLNSGNPVYCSLINRSPATGGLTGASVASGGYIVQTNLNIGAQDLAGIDLQSTYRQQLPGTLGRMLFSLNGTWLQKTRTTPVPGGGTYDCVGLFGPTCQTLNPRWRHSVRVSWETPIDVTAALTWRYIGATKLDHNSGDPLLTFPQFVDANGNRLYDKFNARLPSFSYLDLAATYTFRERYEIRAGINNILDKDPPLVSTEIVAGGAANTYESFDTLGRQWFVAFTARL